MQGEDQTKAEQDTIERLAESAVSVGGLLVFLAELQTNVFMAFDPDTTTTAQVVFQAIIPLSAASGSSFAHIMNGGHKRLPVTMISHAWGNIFLHLVASVVASAYGDTSYYYFLPYLSTLERTRSFVAMQPPEILNMGVWLCIFGVNQHVSICRCHTVKHLNGSPLCEMDKFDRMLEALHQLRGDAFRQTIALGSRAMALSRAWVVSEIATCMKLRIGQRVCVRLPVKIGDDAALRAARTLDVRSCEASRPEDKDIILSSIPDKDQYNLTVRQLLMGALAAHSPAERFVLFGMLPVLCIGTFAFCVIAVASFRRTPVWDRALFCTPLLAVWLVFVPIALFHFYYNSLFSAVLVYIDRAGRCPELFAQFQRVAPLFRPMMLFYRTIVRACGDVPMKFSQICRRICIAANALACALAWSLIMRRSEAKWHFTLVWLLGLTCAMVGYSTACIHHARATIHCRSLQKYTTAGMAASVAVGVAAGCHFLWKCWDGDAIIWSLDEPEKVLFVVFSTLVGLVEMGPLLIIARSNWDPAKVDPNGGTVTDAEFAATRDRIRASVFAWEEVSLRFSNVPEDVAPGDLESFLAQFGPLVGVFPVLGTDMRATGVVTVTYESHHSAQRAIDALNCKFSSFFKRSVTVRWVRQ